MTIADAKAALERGRPVVLVRPPAVEQARDVWELVAPLPPGHGPGAGPAALIICADDASAAEWVAAAPADLRGHAVTGLARAAHILKQRAVGVLAGAPKDLAALLERAALKLDQVVSLIIAWPEGLASPEPAAALDTILAEARAARRIVLSWNPVVVGDFLERHARRALMLGTPPIGDSGAPLPRVGPARYCIVPSGLRPAAVRDALDALNAVAPLLWDGGPIAAAAPAPDAVLCTRLPTRDELAALGRWGVPVVFVTAGQLPYLRSVATVTPLTLPTTADRARDRAEQLRERVSRRLAGGNVDLELVLLDPLFERFDPAEVAAALLALLRQGDRGEGGETAGQPALPARVKVFVNIGKKDRAAAKDLVAALIREADVAKGDIGRIEVRETFSLVEVAAAVADRAVRGLTGVTLRGRRLLARLDREA